MKRINKSYLAILVIVIFSVAFSGCNKNIAAGEVSSATQQQSQEEKTDYPPMVMVNGRVYRDTGFINSMVSCGTADGTVTKEVKNGLPQQDGEANFGTGYEYQLWDNIYINVKIDDDWYIFQDLAVSAVQIPDCVARFTAEVKEVSKDSFSAEIAEIPQQFGWVFGNKKPEEIKPVFLNLENLFTEDGQQVTTTEKLAGKRVLVFFSGKIKPGQEGMSYPLELEQIYRIEIVDVN